jgi:hypothetical protein
MNGRHFTAAEDALLREAYPHVAARDLAAQMGRPLRAIYARAQRLGLRKTQEYMDSPAACRLRRGDEVGKRFRFPKGHVPQNKGLRRPGWFRGRMKETQFKKGQPSPNAMPMWSFRFVDGYLMLKTGAPTPKPITGWEYVHKLIWEQAHGPLPDWKEARLWWKDGDHGNCSLSNLELVSGRDHVLRTTVHNLPSPLPQLIQLKGALKRRIRRMEKENAEKYAGRFAQPPVLDHRVAAGR